MVATRRRQGITYIPMSLMLATVIGLVLASVYTYEEICSMVTGMSSIQTLALLPFTTPPPAGTGGGGGGRAAATQAKSPPKPVTVTMQWDDECFASLFTNPPTNGSTSMETCRCKPVVVDDVAKEGEEAEKEAPDMDLLSRTLSFVEDKTEEPIETLVAKAFPMAVSWQIKSEGLVCGDILDATILEMTAPLFSVTLPPTPAPTPKPTPSPTGANTTPEEAAAAAAAAAAPLPAAKEEESPPKPVVHRAIPAIVTAQADGTYKVSATLIAEGSYELLVRLAFRNWVPRTECRVTSCRENYDVPNSANLTLPFPYITKRLRVVQAESQDKNLATTSSTSTTTNDHKPCKNMDELMDGSWVADPTAMLGYNASLQGQVAPTHGWQKVWQPNTCRLQLYTPEEMREAFEGKHFLVIGDSATHMLLGVMMWIILGPEVFKYPTNGGEFCGHNNRVYDSGDMLFPMRFSFLWAGSPHYCDNNRGLPSVFADESGLARFRRGLGKDVDYIVMNSGAHDLAGQVPLDAYDRVIPLAFDMVLNASQSVREHRERFLWRTTTQHIYNVGDWNAGGRWMNLLAEKHARRYGFSVLDSHKVWLADDEIRRASALEAVFCGDGLHGRTDRQEYCDKTFAEGALAVHHFMQLARREKGQGDDDADMMMSKNQVTKERRKSVEVA